MTRHLLSDPALELANAWQRNFPLCKRPYEALGRSSDLTEGEVLEYLLNLADRRVLGRIGAAVRPNTIGASTLAAMAIPEGLLWPARRRSLGGASMIGPFVVKMPTMHSCGG